MFYAIYMYCVQEKVLVFVQNVANGWIVNYSGISLIKEIMPFATSVNHFTVKQFGEIRDVTYFVFFCQNVDVVVSGRVEHL